jgi:hypothetical protein
MHMKQLVLGLAACVAVGLGNLSPGLQADEPAAKSKGDAAKEFAAIGQDWNDAQQAFYKAYGEAKTPDERRQLIKEKQPKPAAFVNRCLKLADAYPDSPVAIQALAWAVSNGRGTPEAEKAIPRLKEKLAAISDLEQLHKVVTKLPGFGLGGVAAEVAEKAKKDLGHPQAVPLLIWVGQATLYGGTDETSKLYNGTIDLLLDRFPERQELAPLPNWLRQDDDPPWAEKHLRRLMEKTPSESIKSQATFALACVLKNKDVESQAEAEKLFEATADLPGVTNEQKSEAKKELEDMKLHGLGKPAEISGADVDGKAFKLSDYKGKVILLDFWGNW